MLLSVIMPAHNAAAFLEQTLILLAGEMAGVEQVEVIAIDDASTDATASILSAFSSTHSWLRTLSVDFANVGQARRAGVELATGSFVTFLDSDDAFFKGGLSWLVQTLRQHDPDLLMTPLLEIRVPYDGVEPLASVDVEPLSLRQACGKFCEHQALQGHFIGKCVRRNILLNHLPAAMSCYEDMATTPYWIRDAQRILWSDTRFYAYYKRPGSLSDRGAEWRYISEYCQALLNIEDAFYGQVSRLQTAHFWIGFAKELLRNTAGKAFLRERTDVIDKLLSIPLPSYLCSSNASWKSKWRFLRVRLGLLRLGLK